MYWMNGVRPLSRAQRLGESMTRSTESSLETHGKYLSKTFLWVLPLICHSSGQWRKDYATAVVFKEFLWAFLMLFFTMKT